MAVEHRRENFLISDDSSKIDLDAVHAYLTRSYWAEGIPREVVRRAVENSLCFGVYQLDGERNRQIGFARAITDRATYAYLADVYILETHRGQGLARWLMECLLGHPDLLGLRRWGLVTRDAHGLYQRYGFRPLADPSRHLELHDPEIYRR
jgi:GNAT superfamily N-acetyltransferase